MLSARQIERMVMARAWDQLIDRVLDSGRAGCLPVRLRLLQADARAVAALGLALQRVCELDYGPTPLANSLAAALIHMQSASGRFCAPPDYAECAEFGPSGASSHRQVVAPWVSHAIALRGLVDFRRLCLAVGRPADPRLEAAIDRALHALACAQRVDGSVGLDACEDGVILWQLGSLQEFRHAVRHLDLKDRVEGAGAPGQMTNDLRRLALTTAA